MNLTCGRVGRGRRPSGGHGGVIGLTLVWSNTSQGGPWGYISYNPPPDPVINTTCNPLLSMADKSMGFPTGFYFHHTSRGAIITPCITIGSGGPPSSAMVFYLDLAWQMGQLYWNDLLHRDEEDRYTWNPQESVWRLVIYTTISQVEIRKIIQLIVNKFKVLVFRVAGITYSPTFLVIC